MPTETFLRLPEEKRSRFLNAAWEEFTRTSFADVSINQIVRQAGIPRGSFYQYFVDKRDLFVYLMDSVHSRFLEGYVQLIREYRGDLFRSQLAAYDSFLAHWPDADPALNRCFHLLRLNPGMDLQKMMDGHPGRLLLEQVYDDLDLTSLSCRDRSFVRQVFSLTAMALGSAIMDSLMDPSHAPDYRQDLVQRLEIIQHGCLAQSGSGIPLCEQTRRNL